MQSDIKTIQNSTPVHDCFVKSLKTRLIAKSAINTENDESVWLCVCVCVFLRSIDCDVDWKSL